MKFFFKTILLIVLFYSSILTTSYAQTKWTKHEDNPLLDPGTSGAWDDGFVAMPSVLYDGDTYHMWYSMRNDKQRSIGYAFSVDGLSWNKYDDPTTMGPMLAESDPVLNPGQAGEWDDRHVETPSVILLDTTYHIWYRGKSFLTGSSSSIGHAKSKDGINWEKDTLNNPVLNPGAAGSWEAGYIGYHSAVFDGTSYHLWYKAWNGESGSASHAQIGHATSPHPDSSWTKDIANPVLSFGSSANWDYPRLDFPNVHYHNNTYHMWYSGGEGFEWEIGYATSSDGSNWKKYAANPVLSWGLVDSWEDTYVASSYTIYDSSANIYKMWFSGGQNATDGHIGYATAAVDPPVSIKGFYNSYLPRETSLNQNYPNPFNPSTTIEFTLPKSEFVEIKVFNILGKEVSTLVSNKLNQGNHTYTFNGKNLASGIYYYQLTAGDYREVKKMILLK